MRTWLPALLIGCSPAPTSVLRVAPHGPGAVITTSSNGTDSPTGPLSTGPSTTDSPPTEPGGGPRGFIGSPCTIDNDCGPKGAVCLPDPDGFPRGTCSLACEESCPDQDGHPTTSCIDDLWLPVVAGDGPGSCLSRCDFGIFPFEGCRDGYGCVQVERPTEGQLDVYACIPGRVHEIGTCREELAARGVSFEPQVHADEHPADDPSLTCHIDDPVRIGPTVEGVDLRYSYADEADRVLVDCITAHAIVDTAQDISDHGVVEVVHVGTYVCRMIAGSGALSQHGLGKAIDLSTFTFSDGSTASVYDHWEHGVDAPASWEAAFLFDAVHRWHDAWVWNIILTPEYNEVHDNHFHVDMTDGSHFLHILENRPHFLGPPPSGQMD